MTRNRILILGSNGQLGQEILDIIKTQKAQIGSIPSYYGKVQVDTLNLPDWDISNKEQCEDAVSKEYDFVINCCAFTQVDLAESHMIDCYKANTLGSKNIAYACKKHDTPLIHISTDYVFRGDGDTPLNECDITYPLTVYGKTKLAGEDYIRQICDKYFIFRTSWLYGKFGKNFVYTMLNLGKTKEKITVVNDQYGCPTSANDLAYVLLNTALTKEYGLYHCSGHGICSWFDFAQAILKQSNSNCLVEPVTSAEYKTIAQRPKYSALNNLTLQSIGKDVMRDWQIALKSFLEEVL